jgi:hypothetical protein
LLSKATGQWVNTLYRQKTSQLQSNPLKQAESAKKCPDPETRAFSEASIQLESRRSHLNCNRFGEDVVTVKPHIHAIRR